MHVTSHTILLASEDLFPLPSIYYLAITVPASVLWELHKNIIMFSPQSEEFDLLVLVLQIVLSLLNLFGLLSSTC